MLPEILKNDLIKNTWELKKQTPVIFFSKEQLIYNYIFFKEKLNLRDEDIFYSLKTNYEDIVVECLNQLNSNFEIASLGELELMKEHLISPKRIIFSNPVKIPEHIICAYKYGVNVFAFDTESELQKLQKYAPKSKVFLRLKIQNDGAEWKLEEKFGASKSEGIELLELAQKYDLQACGISIHVGWNNDSIENWANAIEKIKSVLKKINFPQLPLEFVNIGGGFPAHNVNQYELLENITETLLPMLNSLKNKYNLRIIAEPGSFIVANSAALATKVYDIVKRENRIWVFADTGIMQGFAWILSKLKYNILHSDYLIEDIEEVEKFVLTGPTVDSHDVFSKHVFLPKNLKIGDLLFICPAGAYISSSREYNKFSFPKFIGNQR